MAKSATKKTVKSATKAAKPGRRAAAAKPIKAVKASAPAKKSVAARAPVISKDELRAQLEKAQATNASLRTKSREATRAAKASAAHVPELEANWRNWKRSRPHMRSPPARLPLQTNLQSRVAAGPR